MKKKTAQNFFRFYGGEALMMSDELPEKVRAALKARPECGISINESVRYATADRNGKQTTERATEKAFYMQCPGQPPRLLEREHSRREVPPGEADEGLAGFGASALEAMLRGFHGERGDALLDAFRSHAGHAGHGPGSGSGGSGGGSSGGGSSGGGGGGSSAAVAGRARPPPFPGSIQV